MASDAETLPFEVGKFLKAFCAGRHRAMKAKEIAHKFQTGLREINEAIRVLRKSGVMIGSSKGMPYGYYMPATREEVDEYLNAFKSEFLDMLDTFKKQRKARERYLDSLVQEQLFERQAETERSAYKEEAGQFGFGFLGASHA